VRLGTIKFGQGQLAEALPLLEEASAVLQEESGEHDPGRAEANFYLALSALAASSSSSTSGAGAVTDAEPALLDSLQRMKVRGPQPLLRCCGCCACRVPAASVTAARASVRGASAHRTSPHRLMRDSTSCHPCWSPAACCCAQRVLGQESMIITLALTQHGRLVLALSAAGGFQEAEALYRQHLKLQEARDPASEDSALAAYKLAVLYYSQDLLPDARSVLQKATQLLRGLFPEEHDLVGLLPLHWGCCLLPPRVCLRGVHAAAADSARMEHRGSWQLAAGSWQLEPPSASPHEQQLSAVQAPRCLRAWHQSTLQVQLHPPPSCFWLGPLELVGWCSAALRLLSVLYSAAAAVVEAAHSRQPLVVRGLTPEGVACRCCCASTGWG
jgi:tetratricopeptide (TPR) repeat protein